MSSIPCHPTCREDRILPQVSVVMYNVAEATGQDLFAGSYDVCIIQQPLPESNYGPTSEGVPRSVAR